MDVQAGKTIALVGPSGCGKSTCIQLLLRYYDPDSGFVEMDGRKTIDYPMEHLRSQIGLVSQEPVLFDRTIAENIAYGDNQRIVPLPEIIDAARKANIHEFIMTLPVVWGYINNYPFFIIVHFFFFRVMKLNWVQKVPNYLVDRNNVLLLLEHWYVILEFYYWMKQLHR